MRPYTIITILTAQSNGGGFDDYHREQLKSKIQVSPIDINTFTQPIAAKNRKFNYNKKLGKISNIVKLTAVDRDSRYSSSRYRNLILKI